MSNIVSEVCSNTRLTAKIYTLLSSNVIYRVLALGKRSIGSSLLHIYHPSGTGPVLGLKGSSTLSMTCTMEAPQVRRSGCVILAALPTPCTCINGLNMFLTVSRHSLATLLCRLRLEYFRGPTLQCRYTPASPQWTSIQQASGSRRQCYIHSRLLFCPP